MSFFCYKRITSFKNHMHKARVCPTGVGATFAACFDMNYWLREFPLSTIANRFELRCQSKATHAIVLQNLSLFS